MHTHVHQKNRKVEKKLQRIHVSIQETIKQQTRVGIWLVGRRSVCGRRLSLRQIGCMSAVCDMDSAAPAAVRGVAVLYKCYMLCLILWQYVKYTNKPFTICYL